MASETSGSADLTRLLRRAGDGDEDALESLLPLVYDELRLIARRQLSHQAPGQTLNTTALVHEAFLKMSGVSGSEFQDRCHFFAVAATAMRQILVDSARRKGSQKRGGNWRRVDLDHTQLRVEEQADLILEVDSALEKLSGLSPRLGRVVECRFFAGMEEKEIAACLGVTDRTVRRDWIKARAWLHRELGIVD
jgi:RNA polymerase sigma factor (TIGR02999 family)